MRWWSSGMMRPCHGRDPGSNEPFRKRLKPKSNEKPPAGFSTSRQPLKKVASKRLKPKIKLKAAENPGQRIFIY